MTTPLGQIADAYDAWIKDADGKLEEMYHYYNSDVARRHGANHRVTHNFVVLTTTLYGLVTAAQLVGQGFADRLRIGESLSDPTPMNFLQDGLRLVSVVRPTFRVARVTAAAGVAGGKYVMSCGVTATAFASRLAGVKLGMRLKDFKPTLKPITMSPKDPKFQGANWAQIFEVLRSNGAQVIRGVVKNYADVKTMIDLNKGPVMFSYAWKIGKKSGRHVVTGFKALGKTWFSDQRGIYTEETLLKQLARGNATIQLAVIVEEASFVPAIAAVTDAGTALTIVASTFDHTIGLENLVPGDDIAWIEENLIVPAFLIPGQVFWTLGDLVNEKVGRPPLGSGRTRSADASRVMMAMGTNVTNPLMLQVASGLGTESFLKAVTELEIQKLVVVTRQPNAPLGISSISRTKS